MATQSKTAKVFKAAITHLLIPRVCHVCKCSLTADEDTMCMHCLVDLPRTGIHKNDFNQIHRQLGHHARVDRAAGWFSYKRDTKYARLLIDAKYRGMHAMARDLGKKCASELISDGFFDNIDYLVPMPMHWIKRLRRGYNQAEEICRGISQITGIKMCKAIKVIHSHGVQARHKKQQRFSSIENTFDIDTTKNIDGCNLLVVDDIITTGASMQEAVRAVWLGNPASVSVLSLGLTQLD